MTTVTIPNTIMINEMSKYRAVHFDNVTLWRQINVSDPTFWRSFL